MQLSGVVDLSILLVDYGLGRLGQGGAHFKEICLEYRNAPWKIPFAEPLGSEATPHNLGGSIDEALESMDQFTMKGWKCIQGCH